MSELRKLSGKLCRGRRPTEKGVHPWDKVVCAEDLMSTSHPFHKDFCWSRTGPASWHKHLAVAGAPELHLLVYFYLKAILSTYPEAICEPKCTEQEPSQMHNLKMQMQSLIVPKLLLYGALSIKRYLGGWFP